jgi:uncharacterized membrane protein
VPELAEPFWSERMRTLSSDHPPSVVAMLGYGGLIPFLGLAALPWMAPIHASLWQQAQLTYAAVILSFVGALHWGFAMLAPDLTIRTRTAAYVWSVVPALLAWAALLLPARIGSLVLILIFLAHYGLDRSLSRAMTLPAWYLPMRWRLTAVAVLSIAAGGLFSRI